MWLEIADKAQGSQKQIAGKMPQGQQQLHQTMREDMKKVFSLLHTLLLFLKFCLHVFFSSFSMLMNTNSCSLPTDWIACVTMRSSLICISHFAEEPAPERFDARNLSAVVSFDSEGTPTLSLTMRVGSHKPTPLQVIAVNTHSYKASCEDYESRILHYCTSARQFWAPCLLLSGYTYCIFQDIFVICQYDYHTHSNRWNLTK